MESLQMAQIMADLNGLQNSDPTAANSLLNAHKTLDPRSLCEKSHQNSVPTPAKFDKLGRRIVIPPPAASLFRENSQASSKSDVSPYNTPLGTPDESDQDMKRAQDLMSLYNMRGRFEQMGSLGLDMAKARVDAVVEKYGKK